MEKIHIDTLIFENPLELDEEKINNMFDSYHEQSCCENHYLDFDSFTEDFQMVKDVLKKIDKIEIYWEEWMWITLFFYDWEERVWIFLAGRNTNNWYYTTNLTLIVKLANWFKKEYDIEKYQE